MSRDYAADMRRIIDAETGHSAYSSRVVAEHIVEKLRATDPDLLGGWLNTQAETIVWQAINDRDRSLRSHARSAGGRKAFAEAAEAHAAGDSAALGRWLATPFSVADGLRKPLAQMTRDDLNFAAGAYEERANQNAMTAALLKAIAKKVRRGTTVSDHFTDEQVDGLWQSISGRLAA